MISTTSTIFSISRLLKSSESNDLLTGKFKKSLVSTHDYELSLVTYVEYYETDFPINGVEYELELKSEDKTRRFESAKQAIEYIDLYIQNRYNVVKVHIDFNLLNRSQYEVKNTSYKGRELVFPALKMSILQVADLDADNTIGFIRSEDLLNLVEIDGVTLAS